MGIEAAVAGLVISAAASAAQARQQRKNATRQAQAQEEAAFKASQQAAKQDEIQANRAAAIQRRKDQRTGNLEAIKNIQNFANTREQLTSRGIPVSRLDNGTLSSRLFGRRL